jgi:hypothetical protein
MEVDVCGECGTQGEMIYIHIYTIVVAKPDGKRVR